MKAEWRPGKRTVGCALLLALLAVCGYMGAAQRPVQAVSVDVTRTSLDWQTGQEESTATAQAQLCAEREQEIRLLNTVLGSTDADAATRKSAAAQLADLTKRMEAEAQTVACLREMGIEPAAAVFGAQGMTVITAYGNIENEADRIRVIDAVCGLTGLDAKDIRIILTKK